jgi:hypothetical protein
MPKTPKGAKRPADVVSNAVHVMRIATGEAKDATPSERRKGGLKGGPARASRLSPEERQAVAQKAAQSRWKRRA